MLGKVGSALPPTPPSTCVVTGGLGGLGVLVADHMASSGRASHLVLLSRSGRSRQQQQQHAYAQGDGVPSALHHAQPVSRPGLVVVAVACDAAEPSEASHLLQKALGLGGKLRSVVHAAGLSIDSTVRQAVSRSAARVMCSKVAASVRLRSALNRVGAEMIHIMLSSVAAALGHVGQASYAYANAVLDALTRRMRSHGQQACSMQPLPVLGVGMGDEQTVRRLELELGGPFHLTVDDFAAWLGTALTGGAGVPLAVQLALPATAMGTISGLAGRPSLHPSIEI